MCLMQLLGMKILYLVLAVITQNYRQLRASPSTHFTLPAWYLVACSVKPSMRFSKCLKESKGVCEMNDKGVVLPIEGKELVHDEEPIYIQFNDK